MTPSVAVITPVRNGMPYLREAIDSIRCQNYEPMELVIVDDGSTDGGPEYIRSVRDLRVRLLSESNLGPAAARNAGIRATQSDFVAFLDADDIWPAGSLRQMVIALSADPEAGLVQGLIRNFRDNEGGARQFFTGPYRYINLGSCLWRRSALLEVGLFDEDLTFSEDMDLLMRSWEKDIPKAELDTVALHYRRHAGNMTRGLSGAGFGTVKAFKKRIERIRRGEYNNDAPRRFSQQAYIGTGPLSQDQPFHGTAVPGNSQERPL